MSVTGNFSDATAGEFRAVFVEWIGARLADPGPITED